MNGLSPLKLPSHLLAGPCTISYFKLDKKHVRTQQLLMYCSEIPTEIKLSVDSRKIEYLAGRYCAFQALQRLGVTQPGLGRNADRSPNWPFSTCGSLSHTEDRVIACAGWQADYNGIGIDIEKTVQPEILPSLQNLVFTERDKILAKSLSLPLCQIATLLFSAKEAFYKFIYPQTQVQMDFMDVSLISLHENTFTLQTNRHLGSILKAGETVRGTYDYEGEHVITFIAI